MAEHIPLYIAGDDQSFVIHHCGNLQKAKGLQRVIKSELGLH